MLKSEFISEENTLQLVLNTDLTADLISHARFFFKKNLECKAKKVILDMHSCKKIDSHGIALLLATHNSVKANGASFQLKNLSPELSEFFKILSIYGKFDIDNGLLVQ
ncbi:MAG: STAS domain-containing protein [Candidatus Riflebacteria bacterium]|nr:STAS domain-containing protein [Candidatus Riflebacteria bacterium]